MRGAPVRFFAPGRRPALGPRAHQQGGGQHQHQHQHRHRPTDTTTFIFWAVCFCCPLLPATACRGAEKRRPHSTDFRFFARFFYYGFASTSFSCRESWCRKTKAIFNGFPFFCTVSLLRLRHNEERGKEKEKRHEKGERERTTKRSREGEEKERTSKRRREGEGDGVLIVLLRFSYQFPMLFQRFSYGFPMVLLRLSHGFPMVSLGFPQVLR